MSDSFLEIFFGVIFFCIPAAIFLSGALAVVLSRRLLGRLLRLVTRTYTVYFSAGENLAACGAGELQAWLEAIFRANGVPLRSLEVMFAGEKASVLIRARVRIRNRFKAKSELARIGAGMLGIEGIQDFYMDWGR